MSDNSTNTSVSCRTVLLQDAVRMTGTDELEVITAKAIRRQRKSKHKTKKNPRRDEKEKLGG